MTTLNYNEKDFQKKLQKDIEMPEIVHEHINQAYRLIENNAVLQKKASKDPYHWMKSGGRIAGGMAAVLANTCKSSGNTESLLSGDERRTGE